MEDVARRYTWRRWRLAAVWRGWSGHWRRMRAAHAGGGKKKRNEVRPTAAHVTLAAAQWLLSSGLQLVGRCRTPPRLFAPHCRGGLALPGAGRGPAGCDPGGGLTSAIANCYRLWLPRPSDAATGGGGGGDGDGDGGCEEGESDEWDDISRGRGRRRPEPTGFERAWAAYGHRVRGRGGARLYPQAGGRRRRREPVAAAAAAAAARDPGLVMWQQMAVHMRV